MPQRNPQSSLIKSAPVDENADIRKLVKGNTLHQILSDSKYIFSVSSTLEKLYRYEFDPLTNEVTEIRIYDRVKHGDPKMMDLRKLRHVRSVGAQTPFRGAIYDVYQLISIDHSRRGYMLNARINYDYGRNAISERMYYIFEKKEVK